MTEVEILNCLMFCEHKDCENCVKKDEENCEKSLMKAARTAIKMQIDCIRDLQEEVYQLKDENNKLNEYKRKSLSDDYIIQSVNNIVDACFELDEDCCAGDYMKIVNEMLYFAGSLQCKSKVSIDRAYGAPKIEKC